MNEKIREVMADEAFVKSCIEAENEEAVQKLFADKGIEMSLTEIEMMKEMIGAVADGRITEEQLEKLSNGGELSEEELEEAAGGWSILNLFTREATGLEFMYGKESDIAKFSQRVASAPKIIGCIAGVAVVGSAIAQACSVDVVGGIKSGATTAYGWVKDNITRW